MSGRSKEIELLKALISTPSFSNEEIATADIWEQWLKREGVKNMGRFHNNVYALSENYDPQKPVVMLNSHHDTVKPSPAYSRDPFKAEIIDGKLYGLGSNDAGASGVALASTFLILKDQASLPFNLLLAISASEEKMGELGMRAFLPFLKEQEIYPSLAIVGEPTGMQVALGERGLVVIDAKVSGKAGHAARNEGINALYLAIEDIERLKKFTPEKESRLLGKLGINVTMINAGTQHNVVPAECTYVIDVRTTDSYTNIQTVEILRRVVSHSVLTPRSTRIQASAISETHPIVKAAKELGMKCFISPTTSDMALMHDIPSIKIGPGDSARSHSADEYIKLSEIEEALKIYPELIRKYATLI